METVNARNNGQPFTSDQIIACRRNLKNQVGQLAPELAQPRQMLATVNMHYQEHKQEMNGLRQELGIKKGHVSKLAQHLQTKILLQSPATETGADLGLYI